MVLALAAFLLRARSVSLVVLCGSLFQFTDQLADDALARFTALWRAAGSEDRDRGLAALGLHGDAVTHRP